jgi:Family of unknown function (DUF6807)
MKTRWFVLGLVASSAIAVRAADKLTMTVHDDRGEIDIRLGTKPILVYAFKTNQFKPYVRELYTLSGENVLRDAPPDHLHHHGLMYAIRVNGVNFWEEKGAPGVEKSVKLLAYNTGQSRDGLPQAKFTQLIHWLAPINRDAADSRAVAFLIEQRTITLTVNEQAGEVAVRWDAAFEVGPRGKVKLHGSDYNGLGLRPPQSFDRVAVFENSEKSPYLYSGPNKRDHIAARWTSMTGKMPKGEITLAMFGKPTNPNGNAVFYTMLEPFAYLSATQALNKRPLEYSSGDKFHLSYLLTVYTEPKSADFLQKRYEAWIKNGE